MQTRINKYLAEQGYCSRRDADGLIKAGKVFVNGKRAGLGDQVGDGDRVQVLDRRPRAAAPRKTYLILNKPVGYSSTTDRREERSLMKLVPATDRLFPVGRLDTESSGLILMTNDGELANKLTHPRYEHEVEYHVALDKPISDSHLRRFAEGMDLDGKQTLPAKVKRLDKHRFAIVVSDGKQIRQMCDAFGYTVTGLERTRLMNLELGKLPSGKTRPLTDAEISAVKR